MHTRQLSMYRLALLAGLLGPASCLAARAAGPDGPAGNGAVTLNERAAAAANDSHIIIAATDPLLWPGSASSCGFLAPYNPHKDPVTVAYMLDFGMLTSSSYNRAQVSEAAPYGDASRPSEDRHAGVLRPHARRGALSGCSGADYRFAAGRMHIAAHDKSLAEAFQAFADKDYVRARELFTEAWDKVGYGGVPALMVARLHLYGLGTPQNTPEAVDWLDKVAKLTLDPGARMRFDPARPAAMSPMVEASWMLAQIYDRGIGTAPDKALARRWYARAADLGYVPALDILARQDLAPGTSAHDHEQAIAELKDAATAGYAPAQYQLARAYYNGDLVPRDLHQAGAWFDAAAHAGLPAAQFAAGHMLDLGEGVPADPRKALVYYKDAALQDDRDAEFALGSYFYGGEVVGKDLPIARKWFAAAARQGQPDAMYNLGVMTARGEGGAKDPAVAYVWLTLAAQSGQAQAAAVRDMLGRTLSSAERRRADTVLQPTLASAQ